MHGSISQLVQGVWVNASDVTSLASSETHFGRIPHQVLREAKQAELRMIWGIQFCKKKSAKSDRPEQAEGATFLLEPMGLGAAYLARQPVQNSFDAVRLECQVRAESLLQKVPHRVEVTPKKDTRHSSVFDRGQTSKEHSKWSSVSCGWQDGEQDVKVTPQTPSTAPASGSSTRTVTSASATAAAGSTGLSSSMAEVIRGNQLLRKRLEAGMLLGRVAKVAKRMQMLVAV